VLRDLGTRQRQACRDERRQPERDALCEVDADIEDVGFRQLGGAHLQRPGIGPVERDVVAVRHRRIGQQLRRERGNVVMEAAEHRRLDGANVDALQHRQFNRLAALDAQRQQPDVEQLVVRVDTEASLGSVLRRRAGPAAAPDGRKAYRAYEPLRRGAPGECVVVHQGKADLLRDPRCDIGAARMGGAPDRSADAT